MDTNAKNITIKQSKTSLVHLNNWFQKWEYPFLFQLKSSVFSIREKLRIEFIYFMIWDHVRNRMKKAIKNLRFENSKIAFTLRTRALGNVFKQLRLDCTWLKHVIMNYRALYLCITKKKLLHSSNSNTKPNTFFFFSRSFEICIYVLNSVHN